jgi:hypothetical protein
MFDGFGSRKDVEPDNKEVRNMRRRQSFIDMSEGDENGDGDDSDDESVSLGLSFGGPKKSMTDILFGGGKLTLKSREKYFSLASFCSILFFLIFSLVYLTTLLQHRLPLRSTKNDKRKKEQHVHGASACGHRQQEGALGERLHSSRGARPS